MKIVGMLIPADDKVDMRTIELDGLKDFQAALGGNIDAVSVQDDSPLEAYVNDDFIGLGLPENSRAIALLKGRHRICGDMILVGPLDECGDDTSFPEGTLPEAIKPR